MIKKHDPGLRGSLLAASFSVLANGTCVAGSGSSYFDVVDTDRNTHITLSEYVERFTWAFRKMDANHDGILAPKEQLVPNGPTVTLEDLTDRLTKQFRRQDRNKDGWLSPKEFLAPPA